MDMIVDDGDGFDGGALEEVRQGSRDASCIYFILH